jgi:hypothetical protein
MWPGLRTTLLQFTKGADEPFCVQYDSRKKHCARELVYWEPQKVRILFVLLARN